MRRNLFPVLIIVIVFTGCMQSKKSARKPESIFGVRPSPAVFYGIQEKQSEVEPQLDKLNIRHKLGIQTDTSEKFITIPSDYPGVKDFKVAQSLPTIDFAIIQGLDPWYLPVTESIHQAPMSVSDGFAIWSGFGDVTKGPDGCFYFAIGNHMYYGGRTYMIKYDPKTKSQSICFDTRKVCGWKPDEWTDGKIHGDPDIDPTGNMYVITFSGPHPLEKDLNNIEYKGGHLIHYNIFSEKATDLGVPLEGDTWSYSAYDWDHDIFFAVGQAKNSVLIYDTNARRLLFGGFLPDGLTWWRRCNMIDRDTGHIYSVDAIPGGERSMRFLRWERRNHTFSLLKSQPPENPVLGIRAQVRAHTRRKDSDGAFWCFDNNGTFFKFYPEEDHVELVGINWCEYGKYTSNMCLSPKGRYIYYLPGSHAKAYEFGTPIVQYDTQTNSKKVLAFLNDFYIEKYGYSPYGSFGLELDEKGESLFFYTNGLFATKEMGSGYGRPALYHLHIPESERVE